MVLKGTLTSKQELKGSLKYISQLDKTLTKEGYAAEAAAVGAALEAHVSHLDNKENPHDVTAAQVGALPSSGGKLSGNLSFGGKTPVIYLADDTSEDRLRIYSGAGGKYEDGASVMLHQKDHGKYPGWFSINAADGTSTPVSLSGRPDGALTWGGKPLYGEHNKPAPADIGAAAAGHKHSAADVGALPRSGGKLSGNLGFEGSMPLVYLAEGTTGDRLRIYSGAGGSYEDGASIMLHQKDHSTYPGWFSLNATDGTADPVSLSGRPDGTLTWGGQKLYGEHNKPAPADIGAAAATHSHTAADVGAAAASHNHSASSITSGTLSTSRLPVIPVSLGGTGATTAAEAMALLGALNLNMITDNAHLISSGDDLNDYTTPDVYRCATGTIAASLSNMPAYKSAGFRLIVSATSAASGAIIQIAIFNSVNYHIYLRVMNENSAWSPWKNLIPASDGDCKDCNYIYAPDGSKEWLNPRLSVGYEYRTTERYAGKPVYAKIVNFGTLPNSTLRDKAHGIENIEDIVLVTGSARNSSGDVIFLPSVTANTYNDDTGNIGLSWALGANETTVYVVTNADRTAFTARVLIKYTKTTD